MAFPVILYDNILRDAGATITASSTESGYSDDDLADFHGWKVWKSGTVTTGITIDIDLGGDTGTADTIGLVNHNITSEAGTVELRADTAAGPNPPTTVRQAAYTPTYGDVDLKFFSAASNLRRWRIVLAKGGNFVNKPYIGELFIGSRTTLTEYLAIDTDPFFRQTDSITERSEGGQHLGAVLRAQTHRGEIALGPAGASRSGLFTNNLNTFIHDHYDRSRPFFFQVDADDSEFARPFYLVKAAGAGHTRLAVGGVWSRLTLRLPVQEAHGEAA
jgi:hypothetical protein